MEVISPKNMSKILGAVAAACDCVCSLDQHDGAEGAGKNGSICGCYCAYDNDSSNDSKADSAVPQI